MPGPVRRQQAGSIGDLVLRWMTAGPRTVPAMCPKNGMNASSAFWSGKMATIEFEDISKDGIPLRPKFVTFREGND